MNIPAAIDAVCPHGLKYAQALEDAAERFGINTPLRAAHWLGQCAHESGDFAHVRENLNYSAEGLMRTWPGRFPTKEIAAQYARDPVKIANHAYSSRLGNGDEASGDGAFFAGKGLIQLTGRANYAEASRDIYGDDRLVRNSALVEQPDAAALTAGWFWHKRGLNALADRDDAVAITKKINGGLIGLAARELLIGKFKVEL